MLVTVFVVVGSDTHCDVRYFVSESLEYFLLLTLTPQTLDGLADANVRTEVDVVHLNVHHKRRLLQVEIHIEVRQPKDTEHLPNVLEQKRLQLLIHHRPPFTDGNQSCTREPATRTRLSTPSARSYSPLVKNSDFNYTIILTQKHKLVIHRKYT